MPSEARDRCGWYTHTGRSEPLRPAPNPTPEPSGKAGDGHGVLGHVAGRRSRSDGRLVRQPRPLPESLPTDEVAVFLADLETHRDRAIVLLMLLGGLRASEVRSLRLADVEIESARVVGFGPAWPQWLNGSGVASTSWAGSVSRVVRAVSEDSVR